MQMTVFLPSSFGNCVSNSFVCETTSRLTTTHRKLKLCVLVEYGWRSMPILFIVFSYFKEVYNYQNRYICAMQCQPQLIRSTKKPIAKLVLAST